MEAEKYYQASWSTITTSDLGLGPDLDEIGALGIELGTEKS